MVFLSIHYAGKAIYGREFVIGLSYVEYLSPKTAFNYFAGQYLTMRKVD